MVIGELVAVVQELLGSAVKVSDIVDLSPINGPAFKLLGLFAGQGFLTFIDITLVTKLGENLSNRLRRELYDAILKQDIAFFDARLQGEVVGRLTQDIADFKSTFKRVVTQGLKSTAQIIGTSIHLIRISPSLTWTLLSSMPFLYFGMNMYGSYLRKLSKEAKKGDSIANGIANEAISNLRTVRAFAAESRELEKYQEAIEESSSSNMRLGFHIGAFQGLTNASIGMMILVILYYGGNLVAKGEMTGGQLMAYMVATQNAQRSLASVGALFGQVIKGFTSAGRVFEYIELKPKIPISGGIQLKELNGVVEFDDVGFSYPTRPDAKVLDKFSLSVPKGSIVALCGQSGSGKSTIGQLIERFYEPSEGVIKIDGVDIRKLDPTWLRSNIGYINQEPVLFATSIYENIRYGRPNATKEEVLDAARQANAADFIEKFPNGYETLVGERGVTLSGGQKQRIAIARAILKNPSILILDEATSALDTQSELLVQQALDKLMKGRTTLVIAHRLSTIQNADLIVVMSGKGIQDRKSGNILEMGTHRTLISKRGVYFKLYNQLQQSE
ncbi:ATP-binding cassette, sub-B (MDR TAP), member 8 [Nowakowskiella sp. JEL0407]|nr:ATP-binding cassette, sub-B (MDR TAP), member 8 [Nowakowskiella sp. JEL0407]